MRQRDSKSEKKIFQIKHTLTFIYSSWIKCLNKDDIILLLYCQNEWKKITYLPFNYNLLQLLLYTSLYIALRFYRNTFRHHIFSYQKSPLSHFQIHWACSISSLSLFDFFLNLFLSWFLEYYYAPYLLV